MERIQIARVDNLQWREPKQKPRLGTLHITTSHILFIDTNKSEEWIIHSHIANLERIQLSKNNVNHHSSNNLQKNGRYTNSPVLGGGMYVLKMKLKIFRSITMVVNNEDEFRKLLTTLKDLSRPNTITGLYAFRYNLPQTKTSLPTEAEQWHFSFEAEFNRQKAISSGKFLISHLNKSYALCKTYPNILCFPYNATNVTINGAARFRSRQRLPSLTYYHHRSEGSIHRCSQPLSGLQNNRSFDDESLCQLITQSGKSNSYIIDTRPKLNAMANRAQGKGYEDERFYRFCRCIFFPIENIHVVRNSLDKFTDSIDNSTNFYEFSKNSLDSGWVNHLQAITSCSVQVAEWVGQGSSIILHCSDGWDRTSQVCALAQVFLDPFYRTVKGFCRLIEKDWCSFGHQFQHRLGQLNLHQYNPSHGSTNLEQEQSPVFLQWIECVYQILKIFPSFFEFNEDLLIFINYHSSSCQFGNFLSNNQKDRVELVTGSNETNCLWSYILKNLSKFKVGSISLEMSDTANNNLLRAYKNFIKTKPWEGHKFWENMYRQELVDIDKVIETKASFNLDLTSNTNIPIKFNSAKVYENGFETCQNEGAVTSTPKIPQKQKSEIIGNTANSINGSATPKLSPTLRRQVSENNRHVHSSGSSNNSEMLASQLGYCKIDETNLTIEAGKKRSNLLDEGADPLGVL